MWRRCSTPTSSWFSSRNVWAIAEQARNRFWTIGGKGVFREGSGRRRVLERAEADLAVHSAKDLPSGSIDGLVIAAVARAGADPA